MKIRILLLSMVFVAIMSVGAFASNLSDLDARYEYLPSQEETDRINRAFQCVPDEVFENFEYPVIFRKGTMWYTGQEAVGLITTEDGESFVVYVDSEFGTLTTMFTLLHELGHYYMRGEDTFSSEEDANKFADVMMFGSESHQDELLKKVGLR